jgi:hypothetical protein
MGVVVTEHRERVPAANTPSLFPIDETNDRIAGTDDSITSDLIVVGSCSSLSFFFVTYRISTERY